MSNEIIFDTIAGQKWLESAADPISKAIRDLFPGEAGQAVKNALHGTWFGHPLHPALVAVPVGAWSLATWPSARSRWSPSAEKVPSALLVSNHAHSRRHQRLQL